jgi:hypothetical protein
MTGVGKVVEKDQLLDEELWWRHAPEEEEKEKE